MKKMLPALLVCMLILAGSAQALSTDELIAITAMPVAVAEVTALPDLPRDDFLTVVSTLNRAAVPAPQFIEVVRYAPVALVDAREPAFVTYVTSEYERGVVGQPLAVAIADRYVAYGIDGVNVVDPPVVTVVQREILPQVVVTRFQPVRFDPLAVVAMPLAVAAVADLADVPQSDLFRFVAALNQAMVPAPQFVEVVRYSPVVLVDQTAAPQFVEFVTTEVDRGVFGRPLAFAIADRLRTTGVEDINIVEPQPVVIVDRDVVLPPVVVTRVARAHPHGGPPGQLKKDLGLQTGAEVVHGTMPRHTARTRTVERSDMDRQVRPKKVRIAEPRTPHVTRTKQRGEPRVFPETRVKPMPQARPASPPKAKQGGEGGGHGQSGNAQGNAQGKGKGKGKG